MKLNLKKATLIKRYKRFLADVILEDGSEVTIHVANTGAMTGCAVPNDTIWYSTSTNLKRKYPFSWELTQTQQNHWICVNTIKANALVEEAIVSGVISELSGYQSLQREVKYGNENSKIDFFLSQGEKTDAYVEVKSVTLLDESEKIGQGYFPDAVTTRGQKHLRELIAVAQQGKRAVLLFAILHTGISTMSPAKHIDPKYADLLLEASQSGVEIMAYRAQLSVDEMTLTTNIPIIL